MKKVLTNDDGKALGAVLAIIGLLVVIPAIAVALTVTGSIKYPPAAVDWPGIGSFIGQYGSFYELLDEGDGEDPGDESVDPTMGLPENNTAQILRDLTYKKQRIEELEGQIETKNDQIVQLEENMQAMKTQLTNYKPENRKALIKIYDRMESTAAVEILSQIPEERAVIILSSLKDSKAAEILAAMDEESAIKITELMAGFVPTRVTDLTNPKKNTRTSRSPSEPPQKPPTSKPGQAGPGSAGVSKNITFTPPSSVSGATGNMSSSGSVGPPPPNEEVGPPPPIEEVGPPPPPSDGGTTVIEKPVENPEDANEKEEETTVETDEKKTPAEDPEPPAPEDSKSTG